MKSARALHTIEGHFCWDSCFSTKRRLMDDSGIRAILSAAAKPGVLSFAGGLPDPTLLPLQQIAECARVVLRDHGTAALQYGVPDGVAALTEQLSRLSKSRGAECSPTNIITTTGSQQGIDLVSNVFLNRGATVAVTRPTYLGALQIFSGFEPEYLEISCDQEGPVESEVKAALMKRPSFFYLVSAFQNPTGGTISRERAEAIVRLCHEYDVPILEDGAYRELFYDDPPVTLRATESDVLRRNGQSYETHGRVIYLGTLSKVMSPGLRVGWVEAPTSVIRGIACLKQGTDLHSSTMNQLIAAEFLKSHADEYWQVIRGACRERRDQAVESVRRHVGSLAKEFVSPRGGLFLWLEVAPAIDTNALLPLCVEKFGVAFAPGALFFAQRPAFNTMRLSFSNLSLEKIDRGIEQLGSALRLR